MNKNEEFVKGLYDDMEEELKETYEHQKDNRDELLQAIAMILLSNTIVNDVVSLSNGDYFKTYTLLSKIINSITEDNIKQIKDNAIKILSNTTKNTFKHYSYNSKLKDVNKIINNNFKGKHFSERIWNNEKEVAKKLHIQCQDFLKGKINVNQIEKEIKNTFNTSAYNARRLVETEVSRCHNQAFDRFCREVGVKKVRYNATFDNVTCSECANYDGEVFEFNKKFDLPMHPLCRCFYEIVDGSEKTYVNESEYLRVENSENVNNNDLQAIENDLSKIPLSHRKILEEYVNSIKVVSSGTSSFNRKTGVITILEGMEEGELIHELGHALETKFDLFNNSKFIDILKCDLPDSFTCLLNITQTKEFAKGIEILGLDNSKFISKYQSRVYEFDMYKNGRINFNTGEFNYKVLGEYFSEGYKEFILNPNNLKNKDIKLYNFIKELI